MSHIRKLIFVMLFLLALQISSASAWGPNTHIYLTKTVIDRQDTPVAIMCKPYEQYLLAGVVLPDFTVLDYYQNYPMGETYRATHNWNFESRVFELAGDDLKAKCNAYGISTHEIQDTIPHNYFVPTYIESTRTPNWLIHPIIEAVVEAHVITEHPEINYLTAHAMDILFDPENEYLLENVQVAVGPATQIDVRQKTYELSTMLGSFYTDAFKPRQENIFFTFFQVMSPIVAKFTVVNDADVWLDMSEEYTVAVYNNWAIRLDKNLTPHGSDAITKVDTFSVIIWSIIPLLLTIAIYIYLLRKVGFIKKAEDSIRLKMSGIFKRG